MKTSQIKMYKKIKTLIIVDITGHIQLIIHMSVCFNGVAMVKLSTKRTFLLLTMN